MAALENPHQALISLDFRRNANKSHASCALVIPTFRTASGEAVDVLMANPSTISIKWAD